MIATRVETQADLAREMGVSRRTIIEWTQRKGFPKNSGDGYDVDAVRAWHMDNVSKAIAGGGDEDDLKTRRLLAECDKLEQEARFKKLKNDTTEGELVRRDDVVAEFADFLSEAKPILESLPDDLAKEMPEELRVTVRNLAKVAVDRTFRKMASWRPAKSEVEEE